MEYLCKSFTLGNHCEDYITQQLNYLNQKEYWQILHISAFNDTYYVTLQRTDEDKEKYEWEQKLKRRHEGWDIDENGNPYYITTDFDYSKLFLDETPVVTHTIHNRDETYYTKDETMFNLGGNCEPAESKPELKRAWEFL